MAVSPSDYNQRHQGGSQSQQSEIRPSIQKHCYDQSSFQFYGNFHCHGQQGTTSAWKPRAGNYGKAESPLKQVSEEQPHLGGCAVQRWLCWDFLLRGFAGENDCGLGIICNNEAKAERYGTKRMHIRSPRHCILSIC